MSEIESILEALSLSPGDQLTDAELERETRVEIARQNLRFRKCMFWIVIVLMIFEVVVLFVIVILQGFGGVGCWVFDLDEWVLAAINAGVLLQTFGLAQIITKALFPNSSRS